VKQSLSSVKQSLHQLIKTAGVKEDVLVTLGVVGEVSYAWEIVDCFTLFMQQGVKKEPSLVGKLRTTFLKLSTALEGPVLRISQARSKDFVSVSQYYSSELVGYVRRVLQIIPETVFEKLDQIIRLQTDQIKEVPTRLDKDKLRDYAQLDERFEVARLTHSISVFTEGMLAMKSTLVGVIKVDPKRLLEDGIRKELVRQVSQALNTTLTFNPKAKNSEIFDKLAELSKTMAGFKRSFEYIQDYVSISGLKIWQEELSRIINFNVEQEANLFLRQKTPAWASVYQSKSIPIPIYQNSGSDAYNFIGRLANEIISCTSPKSTIYVKPMQTWYDCRSTHAEVASLSLFSSLESAVGTIGLAGLDRLLGLKAVTTLQNLTSYLDKTVFRDKSWVAMLENLGNSLSPTENVVAKPAKFYADFVSPRSKVTSAVLDYLVVLGQLQLLRKQIAYRLAMASNFDAKVLNSALKAFNR
jgi:WASH complex subunit strumpellin